VTVDIAGAIVLVTGASSGIGRATALALARAGATVHATGRDEAALEGVAKATHGTWLAADLADPVTVDKLADWAGPVDILINNAGFGLAGSFIATNAQEIDRLIRVNLAAPVLLTRAFLPGMLERDRGHVVNVASISGHVGVAGEAAYSATKAGLIALTEALRYELHGTNVGASVVVPGAVRTKFFEREGLPYERRFPRLVPPETVAAAVLRAIRRNIPEVFSPRWMAFPAWLRGAMPWVYRRGAHRWG
jgi:short-subunit dehydrogenase